MNEPDQHGFRARLPEARFVHVDGDDQNGTSRNGKRSNKFTIICFPQSNISYLDQVLRPLGISFLIIILALQLFVKGLQSKHSLARILVLLMNHDGRDDRWIGSKIEKLIRDHAWPDDGADEAIEDLTRREILRRQSNNYLSFYRERVQVAEHAYLV